MVGWQSQLNGHEVEQTGDDKGQVRLMLQSMVHKVSGTT